MSADESRKKANEAFKAESARTQAETVKKHVSDSEHLYNHFMQLIKKASNQGKFNIEKQTFPSDRFRQKVLDDVLDKLETEGYKVQVSNNNALQQTTFHISW